jgi:hypothetical protein
MDWSVLSSLIYNSAEYSMSSAASSGTEKYDLLYNKLNGSSRTLCRSQVNVITSARISTVR